MKFLTHKHYSPTLSYKLEVLDDTDSVDNVDSATVSECYPDSQFYIECACVELSDVEFDDDEVTRLSTELREMRESNHFNDLISFLFNH